GIVDALLATVLIAARVLAVVHGPAVDAQPGYRAALIEQSVVYNAALAAYMIRKELHTAGGEAAPVVYGAYGGDTRRAWAPVAGARERVAFADPRADLAGFRDLGRAAAESARVRALLRAR